MRNKLACPLIILIALLFGTSAHTQEEKKPAQIGMLLEYFEVDHRTANKLIRKYSPRAADAKELRDTLGEMMKLGEASLIETGWLRARSGQRALTQSIEENIYPTEFDPPEIPNFIGGPEKNGTKEEKSKATDTTTPAVAASNQVKSSPAIHRTAATPTAFENQHLGLTFEVDPVLSVDHKIVHINAAPKLVSRLEDTYFTRAGFEKTAWGIDHVFMPKFHRMAIHLITETKAGNYNLMGLHAPPEKPDKRILCLLKVDVFPY